MYRNLEDRRMRFEVLPTVASYVQTFIIFKTSGIPKPYNVCLQVERSSFYTWRAFTVHRYVHKGSWAQQVPLSLCTTCYFRLDETSGVYSWRTSNSFTVYVYLYLHSPSILVVRRYPCPHHESTHGYWW
jgi:hypothetical protein